MGEAVAKQPCSGDRAKPLKKQPSPGRLLDMALLRTGVSKAEVARIWGMARPNVHKVINGTNALTARRFNQLPVEVRDAYRVEEGRALGNRAWVVLPEVGKREVDHQALADMSREHGETIALMAESMAHGEPTDAQKREIARELREDVEQKLAYLAALEGE